MENSTKIISIITLCVIVAFCGSPNNLQDTAVNVIKDVETNEAIKHRIKDNLYLDTLDNIFIKVKNRKLRHPSTLNKPWPDSIYLNAIYLKGMQQPVPLKNLIDTATFKMENDLGTYFSDTFRIYIYSVKPLPQQFFALPRSNEMFIDSKKAYLLNNNKLYFWGIKVEGLNNNNLHSIKYPNKKEDGFIEFITDDKLIYNCEYALDKERLSFFDDLSDETKIEIIKRFNLK